jgi:hypothetical protein
MGPWKVAGVRERVGTPVSGPERARAERGKASTPPPGGMEMISFDAAIEFQCRVSFLPPAVFPRLNAAPPPYEGRLFL